MKIVLVEDVSKVGGAGDIVTVADGYARNFLIPRGLAVQATREEVQRADSRRRAAAARRAKSLADMSALAQHLEGQHVTLRARVGPSGRLYGSVTAQAIAEAVAAAMEREFDHRMVELEAPLRELGEHPVRLRLGPEVVATVTIRVEAEGGGPAPTGPAEEAQPPAAAGQAAAEDDIPEASEAESQDGDVL